MKNIYLLEWTERSKERSKREVRYIHDISYSKVVVAKNELEARTIANTIVGDEARGMYGISGFWMSDDYISCNKIGTASNDLTVGIICHDFRAG